MLVPCRYLSCPSCGPSPRMGTCYDADLLSSRVICYMTASIRGTALERSVSQPLWPRPGGGGTRATMMVAGSPCHRACIANLQCDPGKGGMRGRARMSETCFCRRSPILWDHRGSHIPDMHAAWVDSLDPGSPTCKSHPSSGESTGDTSRRRHGPRPFGLRAGRSRRGEPRS